MLLQLCCFFSLIKLSFCAEDLALYNYISQNGIKAFDLIPSILDRTIFGAPLLAIAVQGDFEDGAVEALLARGANPNGLAEGSSTLPPLFMAMMRNVRNDDDLSKVQSVIKALLAAGAETCSGSYGLNALQLACCRCTHPAVFELILQNTRDSLETPTKSPLMTPLDFSVRDSQPEKVRMLLRAGAKPSVRQEFFAKLSKDDPIRVMIERAREIWSQCQNETATLVQGGLEMWGDLADPLVSNIIPRLVYAERMIDF